MPKHSIKTVWQNVTSTLAGDSSSTTDTVTADAESNLDVVVNVSVTDQAVAFAVDHAKVQLVYLLSDADITIETNNGSTPTDTIMLTAGVAVAWTINDGLSKCPFSASVTALYLTNAGTKQANVTLRCLYNL